MAAANEAAAGATAPANPPTGPSGKPTSQAATPPLGSGLDPGGAAPEETAGDGVERIPVGGLSREAARYRVARNESIKEAAGLRAILTSHGIDADEALARTNLEGVRIEKGRAVGEVAYRRAGFTPSRQGPGVNPPAGKTSGTGQLSKEDVRSMSREQIKARWKEVEAVLKQRP